MSSERREKKESIEETWRKIQEEQKMKESQKEKQRKQKLQEEEQRKQEYIRKLEVNQEKVAQVIPLIISLIFWIAVTIGWFWLMGKIDYALEKMTEPQSHNPKVVSSSLTPATRFIKDCTVLDFFYFPKKRRKNGGNNFKAHYKMDF